ncbi:hypothetical protein EON79_06225 [bacterium]|nr:MAG: hypothetical protein EON79_06225 [bacterium]
MKRLLLLAPLFAVASCAKFPGADSVTSQFPRINFVVQLRGEVNDSSTQYGDQDPGTAYLYYVVIRAITTDEQPNVGDPSPVIGENTPNGFVAGSPTHFIEYQSNLPTQQFPFRLFRFNPGPTQNDPDNPINLGSFIDTTNIAGIGPIVNFTRPGDTSNKNELRFDLFLNQLATPEIPVESIKRIQVNILTMSRKSTLGAGDRSWDALGDARNPGEIVTTVTLDVRSNRIIDNTSAGDQIEPIDDVVTSSGFGGDPSLDIQYFSIEARQP